MARTTDKVALNDALADTAVETLEMYKEHMRNGRYEDAKQCLCAVRALTEDVTAIEDHDENEAAVRKLFNSENSEVDRVA